ncbi:uncharacterized protein BDV17DRAFT_108745 [Aspergillus undulatus]|uniref:uncharacterized protein n=1 Tax=Aspergillus undulatus TaxID=1810928 RepID=UPI003CCD248C
MVSAVLLFLIPSFPLLLFYPSLFFFLSFTLFIGHGLAQDYSHLSAFRLHTPKAFIDTVGLAQRFRHTVALPVPLPILIFCIFCPRLPRGSWIHRPFLIYILTYLYLYTYPYLHLDLDLNSTLSQASPFYHLSLLLFLLPCYYYTHHLPSSSASQSFLPLITGNDVPHLPKMFLLSCTISHLCMTATGGRLTCLNSLVIYYTHFPAGELLI